MFLLQILSVLKYEKGNLMPEEYIKSFKEAFAVFQHATMYATFSLPSLFRFTYHMILTSSTCAAMMQIQKG